MKNTQKKFEYISWEVSFTDEGRQCWKLFQPKTLSYLEGMFLEKFKIRARVFLHLLDSLCTLLDAHYTPLLAFHKVCGGSHDGL